MLRVVAGWIACPQECATLSECGHSVSEQCEGRLTACLDCGQRESNDDSGKRNHAPVTTLRCIEPRPPPAAVSWFRDSSAIDWHSLPMSLQSSALRPLPAAPRHW